MASERQIAANRRNAQKSTGPQTTGGKERASRNAYRHGLASRTLSQSHAEDIEALACEIEGDSRSLIVNEWARTVAEATVELNRVRFLRSLLIDQLTRLGKSCPSSR